MSKLKGNSSLTIDHAPQPKQPEPEKLGLIDSATSQMRSYRLSIEAIAILEELTARLSEEARFKLSMGKVLEILIFYAENMNFLELMNAKK